MLLSEANMPATDADGLKAIAAIEGRTFTTSIVEYQDGNPSVEKKEYVDTVLAAVSIGTRDLLAGWGYTATTTVAPIIAMLFRQFSANHPRLSDEILLQIVHRAAAMYANTSKDD